VVEDGLSEELGVFNVVRELASKVVDDTAVVREVVPDLSGGRCGQPSEDTIEEFGRCYNEYVSV
jgi:hypothetical protein